MNPTLAAGDATATRVAWLAEHPTLAASSFGQLLAEYSPVHTESNRPALPLAGAHEDDALRQMRERYLRRLPELRAAWASG